MKTIAIMNNKGGVGKTVTTINLADTLVRAGMRCTICDIDGQRNLTRFFFPDLDLTRVITAKDLLLGDGEPLWSDNLMEVREGLLVLPGTPDLYTLDVAGILGIQQDKPIRKRAFLDLRDAMEEDGEMDFLLFDCPPGFTSASCAALAACDEVVIPMVVDGFNFDGISDMSAQITSMRMANAGIRIRGVLINQWRNAEVVHQGETLLRSLGVPVFDTVIRRTEKVPESTIARTPLAEYSPGSSAARDYRKWVRELLEEV